MSIMSKFISSFFFPNLKGYLVLDGSDDSSSNPSYAHRLHKEGERRNFIYRYFVLFLTLLKYIDTSISELTFTRIERSEI